MAQGASAGTFRHKKVTGEVIDRLRRPWHGRVTSPSPILLVLAAVVGGEGMLVIGATLASAELYDGVVEQDGVAELDRPVLQWIVEHRNPALDTWATHYTDVSRSPSGRRRTADLIPSWLSVSTAVTLRGTRSHVHSSWTPSLARSAFKAGSSPRCQRGSPLVSRVTPGLTKLCTETTHGMRTLYRSSPYAARRLYNPAWAG